MHSDTFMSFTQQIPRTLDMSLLFTQLLTKTTSRKLMGGRNREGKLENCIFVITAFILPRVSFAHVERCHCFESLQIKSPQ